MEARREQQYLAEQAHQHWCSAHMAKAVSAWSQGIHLQRSQNASLHAIACRWSKRTAAQCWDAWRLTTDHSRELRDRLGAAVGELAAAFLSHVTCCSWMCDNDEVSGVCMAPMLQDHKAGRPEVSPSGLAA